MEVELLTIVHDLEGVTYMLMYKGSEEDIFIYCYDCIQRAGEVDPINECEGFTATKLDSYYLVLIEKLH